MTMTTRHDATLAAFLSTVTLLVGCAGQASHKAFVADKLEPYECGTITRLHTYSGVFLASQPRPDDLRQARLGGVKTVINLRLPDEVKNFDEPKLVTELGMGYYNVGFNGPDMLTDDVLDRIRALLNNEHNKPILMHCSSANRAGAVWLAHRVIDGGLIFDEALAEAKTVGLKSPPYIEKVRSYIDRRRY